MKSYSSTIKSSNSDFLFSYICKPLFLELSNILATAAPGFNWRLSRAYSMIYMFLLSSRSRQCSPLPTGICIEKHLQLSRSCDCLKRVWVSSYIPASFQPWLSSLNGPRCVRISLLECKQKRLWFLHWEHVAFLVHVSSRDARICAAKPHGTVQQCLCGIDQRLHFIFYSLWDRVMMISEWGKCLLLATFL